MNKITSVFSKIKNVNDDMFLNHEKITIINQNKLYIQNYKEILEIHDHLIQLKHVEIKGKDLKIKTISKYFLEITGRIFNVQLGDGYKDE